MPKADKIRFTKFLPNKGGLISEHFPLCAHLPKNVQTHYSEHNPPKEKVLRKVIWHIFWKWSQSERLSGIKPPLVMFNSHLIRFWNYNTSKKIQIKTFHFPLWLNYLFFFKNLIHQFVPYLKTQLLWVKQTGKALKVA